MLPDQRSGFIAALGAYIIWALLPAYFKLLDHVSAVEILSHRIVWSVIFLSVILTVQKQWGNVRTLFQDKKAIAYLAVSSFLIGANWLIFIWAVNDGRILETSLGYFINPIISMFLAMLLLGERMRPIQWIALILAAIGVAIQVIEVGYLPWVTLGLALSFGFYGITKKLKPVESRIGIFVETLFMLPISIFALIYFQQQGKLIFGHDLLISILLPLAGVLTAIPLMLFGYATQRLTLTVISFIQYLAPSITFLMAIFVYGETLTTPMLTTFIFIWTGLIFYSIDTMIRSRRKAA